MRSCVRPVRAVHMSAGPDGSSRTGSQSSSRTRSAGQLFGFSQSPAQPVCHHVIAPCSFSRSIRATSSAEMRYSVLSRQAKAPKVAKAPRTDRVASLPPLPPLHPGESWGNGLMPAPARPRIRCHAGERQLSALQAGSMGVNHDQGRNDLGPDLTNRAQRRYNEIKRKRLAGA